MGVEGVLGVLCVAEMTAISIKITGNVQGVFFRANTQEKAQELGINGWVRNCEDGSVEVHAEGSDEALKKLEEWCHTGPPSARIDFVDTKKCEEEGLETFEIKY